MKKPIGLFLLLLVISTGIKSQEVFFNSVFQLGSESADVGSSITTDKDGNLYASGFFKGNVDFDPGIGEFFLDAPSGATYLAKYSPEGSFLWACQFPGYGNFAGWEVITDTIGNVFVFSYFAGTYDFDPGPGVFEMTATSSSGFLVKLSADGSFINAVSINSSTESQIRGIAIDKDQNVIITGYFRGVADLNTGIDTLFFNAISSDIFVVKMDNSLNFLWAKHIEGEGSDDIGNSIDTDNSNNIYYTGWISENAAFDSVPEAIVEIDAVRTIFVCKLSSEGEFVWVKILEGKGNNLSYSLRLNEENSIFLSGHFRDSIDFDPGPDNYFVEGNLVSDAFLVKMTSNGELVWVKTIPGPGYIPSFSMVLDQESSAYFGGYFADTAYFSFESDTLVFVPTGSWDGYLCKIDSAGYFKWVQVFTGQELEGLMGLHVNSSYEVFATGNFRDTVDFASSAGGYSLVSNGLNDVFVLKFSQCIFNLNVEMEENVLFSSHSGASYQWVDCNNGFSLIPGENNSYFTATEDGSYAVIIDNGYCSDTSDCYTITGTGISKPSESFKIYPNPAEDFVKIKNETLERIIFVRITDIYGKTIQLIKDSEFDRIDLSGLRPAAYFLEINTSNYSEKFLLIKN